MPNMLSGVLEKIDDFRWRIPTTYKSGMRVPGVIYADEKMIEQIGSDKAPEQVANVAFLPGICSYSLAMPDIHWGYGFCIGGVAATDIANGGVISPGGVGFDINCLSNSFILNELGYQIEIKEYEKDFFKRKIFCMDFCKKRNDSTDIVMFLKQKPKTSVLNVVTETARQIDATSDHPFYTEDGMKALGRLRPGALIAVYPFEGVRYQEPGSGTLIDKNDIRDLLVKWGKSARGNSLRQIMTALDRKGMLPIRFDSWQLPYLIKMMGYCFGDGVLYLDGKKRKGTVCFYGKKEDLVHMQGDLSRIGFAGSVHSRSRHHAIKTAYSTVEFDSEEVCLKVASNSFAAIMACLGMPVGNKCRAPYHLPPWLFDAPLWQKRLFLAGLFGAELSSPKTMKDHGYTFYCPVLSMNKRADLAENGKEFLGDISKLLREFGVDTKAISQRQEFVNKDGLVSHRLRLILSGTTADLLNLYSKVGYEYNEKRQFLANVAAGYLRFKSSVIKERKEVASLALALHGSGQWETGELKSYLSHPFHITDRFIERSFYEKRRQDPRMWGNDPTFEEYARRATRGLGRSGMVWERIAKIADIEYDDYVYDFTVSHPHHNFVANNFVVSNCGVRLVRTELEEHEVVPRLKDLVGALYNDIPAGVGSKGDIRVSEAEERKLLMEGSKWVVDRGYGRPDDLEYTEEKGAVAGADPGAVSPRAYERGKAQAGTLGSGNHFLEVQVIDQIYDKEAAGVLGLRTGQITIMIHSGSRGIGYQICDDYSQSMIRCLEKYSISVPDRQLACAPVNSPEGKSYLGAMRCAANYAWANRQCLMHLTRLTFEKIFKKNQHDLGMDLIYDVAHNIAKIETYSIDGKTKALCVHRKGATRAFPPGHADLPGKYKDIGQPVIIPGDMGRNSFLLVGTRKAEETFYSTCHGAGRLMSRSAAIRACRGRAVAKELEAKGILVRSSGRETLAEEVPEAYKNVTEVVSIVHNAGISKKVCRMRPLGVIKG